MIDFEERRKLGLKGRQWELVCISCGEVFYAKRNYAKTCSPRCRQQLSRGIRASMAASHDLIPKCDK